MCDKKKLRCCCCFSTTSTECCKQNAEGERKELAAAAMTELNGNDRIQEKKKITASHFHTLAGEEEEEGRGIVRCNHVLQCVRYIPSKGKMKTWRPFS